MKEHSTENDADLDPSHADVALRREVGEALTALDRLAVLAWGSAGTLDGRERAHEDRAIILGALMRAGGVVERVEAVLSHPEFHLDAALSGADWVCAVIRAALREQTSDIPPGMP